MVRVRRGVQRIVPKAANTVCYLYHNTTAYGGCHGIPRDVRVYHLGRNEPLAELRAFKLTPGSDAFLMLLYLLANGF